MDYETQNEQGDYKRANIVRTPRKVYPKPSPRFATQAFVKRMLDRQLETKVHSWTFTSTAPLTGGIVNLLGDSGNRIPYNGSSFEILNISVMFETAIADADNQVRLTFLKNKTDDYTPTIARIYTDGAVQPYLDNFLYEGQRDEWTLMLDEHIQLNTTNNRTEIRKYKFSFKDWVIHTRDSASATYQGKNWPYVAYSSDSAAVAHPPVEMKIRVLYRDS